jgi:cytochrome c556
MRVHALLLTLFALCLAACSKQEPAEPEQPAAEQAAVIEEVAEARPEFDQAFIDHMHAHAEQLDELMFALADDDLEAAMTPAFWLSRHDAVEGIPEEWQQYVTGMREAAAAVEAASDLDTAKTAAESISDQCQACHSAAGISTNSG